VELLEIALLLGGVGLRTQKQSRRWSGGWVPALNVVQPAGLMQIVGTNRLVFLGDYDDKTPSRACPSGQP
jgi:hypothetical protein